jgi:hypothetical protein
MQTNSKCWDTAGEDAFLHALGVSLDATRREDAYGDQSDAFTCAQSNVHAADSAPRQSWRRQEEQHDMGDYSAGMLVGGGRGRGRGLMPPDGRMGGGGDDDSWEVAPGRGRGRGTGAASARGRGRGRGVAVGDTVSQQHTSHGYDSAGVGEDQEEGAAAGSWADEYASQSNMKAQDHMHDHVESASKGTMQGQYDDEEDDEELRMAMRLSAEEAQARDVLDRQYFESDLRAAKAAAAGRSGHAGAAYHEDDWPNHDGMSGAASKQDALRPTTPLANAQGNLGNSMHRTRDAGAADSMTNKEGSHQHAAKTRSGMEAANAPSSKQSKLLKDTAASSPAPKSTNSSKAVVNQRDNDDFWDYGAPASGTSKAAAKSAQQSNTSAGKASAAGTSCEDAIAMALLSELDVDDAIKLYVVEAARDAAQQTEEDLWECVGDLLMASGAGDEVRYIHV